MPLSLSHIGEAIFAEMANLNRLAVLQALDLIPLADPEFVQNLDRFAFAECSLSPHGGYIFDGASRVDVTLWVRPDLAVACELKLGANRLSKTRIDDEFLVTCRLSHQGTRIAGNMMAILDRRFGTVAPADGLCVMLGAKPIELSRSWIVIVQQSTLAKWKKGHSPSFSEYTKCVSMNSVVEKLGGKDAFNSLVQSMLEIDYFDEWLCAPE